MNIIEGIPVYGKVEEGALTQILNCSKDAQHCALMADHHLGYAVPIGGVVAYEKRVSPSGVGYDIACGNKAVLIDASANDIKSNISKIMDDIVQTISFGVGQNNNEQVEHVLFEDDTWNIDVVKKLKQSARNQLGTVGSGNHYVDIFEDEQERIWIGVHFGSRGLGHKIATHFIKAGGGKDGIHVDPVILEEKSDLGEQYIKCMQLAGRYAYAGRDWVCARVAKLIGAKVIEEVHNHHNFAWKEKHSGKDLWVVRKGATPAFPGQLGFVGGSMGDISVILKGVEHKECKQTLYSTVHGAGRVMGRRAAAGRYRWKKRKGSKKKQRVQISPGKISRTMMSEWVRREGVELRGAGVDESPHCYKRLPDVLRVHKNTIEIVHTLKPLGVAMAGEDEFDPYRD